jgi:hypothetical protein
VRRIPIRRIKVTFDVNMIYERTEDVRGSRWHVDVRVRVADDETERLPMCKTEIPLGIMSGKQVQEQ